jgi:oxaloacetate decarboxylase gamma subunit
MPLFFGTTQPKDSFMSEKVQLLLDGVKLMVMGMVAVYVFLILMVFLMNLLSKVLAPLGKAGFMEPAAPVKKAAPKKAAAGNDAAIAAVAVAAVKAHISK